MSYDPRFHRFESTASSPSLRAFDHHDFGTPTQTAVMAPHAEQDSSANVKVVVRVRQFLKRGM
jgi:hypothetical protein